MANQTEQIAASQQRQQIPQVWQLDFQTWTNGALLSLLEDEMADPEVRAFAGWELDYRIAFSKTSLPQKETAPINRSRWTMAGAVATLPRLMEEQE